MLIALTTLHTQAHPVSIMSQLNVKYNIETSTPVVRTGVYPHMPITAKYK